MSSKVFIGESLLANLWKNNQDQTTYHPHFHEDKFLDYYTNLNLHNNAVMQA
ncbi:MAG TPA: hypothetical protein VI489_05285 [Candidatus Brocadiaceae bacterium]